MLVQKLRLIICQILCCCCKPNFLLHFQTSVVIGLKSLVWRHVAMIWSVHHNLACAVFNNTFTVHWLSMIDSWDQMMCGRVCCSRSWRLSTVWREWLMTGCWWGFSSVMISYHIYLISTSTRTAFRCSGRPTRLFYQLLMVGGKTPIVGADCKNA